MNIIESFKVAIRGLASNKMRTALTMLGIIIGVGVVILVVAIGQGAAARITEQVNSLGTNLLSIWPGASRLRINAVTAGNSDTNTTTSPGTQIAAPGSAAATASTTIAASQANSSQVTQTNKLVLADADLIAKSFPQTVAAVAPQCRDHVTIRLDNMNSSTNVQGSTPDYAFVNNAPVDHGRWFTPEEMSAREKVCVAGQTIADKLTGDATTDLTGHSIYINSQAYKVVGMLAPKGAGAWGQDQDDVIIMPITTAMLRLLNRKYLDFISIRCTSPTMMPLAQEQISNFLRTRHHLEPPFPDNDDFTIRSQTELLARQQSITSTMTSLLSAVAIISLVVGGIGIMNIMLVSVTERTREIGIRKAIGATPRDIMLQFLIEASIISLQGGLIGIVLGIGGSMLLKNLGWSTEVNMSAIVAAVVVSAGVGIFFGIYPAQKAAGLHPIDALRYE